MLTRETDQYYVLRNTPYMKKMNLSEDIACWLGWQMFIKTKQHVLVCMVMRRQYLPPL